ncbi:MAG: VWA domain-containing protein [Phycisphaerales bacterium]|nr:VWA domain-containing protein [Phycisphaerales bacterium]
MIWLSPWVGFWLLACLAPILILLYILRLRRATRIVPSTHLWNEAAEDIQANTPFQRLRRNLLLALQMVALAMLALGLMQPRIETATGRGERTVLLIDTSSSMKTLDGPDGEPRFQEAIDAAHDAIDRLHPSSWFFDDSGATMIVSLGAKATIVQPFTSSNAALHASLERLEAVDTTASLEEGLAMSRIWSSEPDPENPRGVAPVRIELFTDGGLLADYSPAAEDQMALHLVGRAETSNRGVGSLMARRRADDPASVQVFTSLWNWLPESRSEQIQLGLNGAARRVVDVTMPPAIRGVEGRWEPGRRDLVFDGLRASGDVSVEVRFIEGDAAPVDDAAWVTLEAPRRLAIVHIGEKDSVVGRGLTLLPGVDVEHISEFDPGSIPAEVDLVVVSAGVLTSQPPMATLAFGAEIPSSHCSASGHRGSDSAIPGGSGHPALRGGGPRELWVGDAQNITFDSFVDVLIEGSSGPLLLAWEEDEDRRIHVAFDPTGSTWPWDPTFITFLADSVDWLTRRGHASGLPIPSGDVISLVMPSGVSEVEIVAPDGRRFPRSVDLDRRVVWGPVEQAGPWLVVWKHPDAGHRVVAVAAPVADEGDVSRPPLSEIIGEDNFARIEEASRPLWPWALIASLLVLLLEWGIYCRRIG